MKVRAWLSLGSNIDREAHLRAALTALEAHFGALRVSSVYESDAVGFSGAPFLNLVAGIETNLPPVDLVNLLRGIENQEGRTRGGAKFSSRTLDIDLLTYGDQVIERGGVVEIPRDEITRYAFVLRPLSEVAGEELHPVSGRSYKELWSCFEQPTQTTRPVPLDFRHRVSG